MAYPQEIDKFTEKLNKLDNNTYVIEECVEFINGLYEGELEHDNVSTSSINVYTGSKLTGDKVENVIVSTPSLTPWKRNIKIFSNISPVYISYETQGDTVESEDINKVQDSVTNIETEVDRYKNSNDLRVSNDEVKITNVENSKADKTYVDTELNKRYTKDETYTKTETDQRIQMVVNAAPAALDTLKEIADALNDDPNFAATITTELSKKVDKVDGKQLSTEDYTTTEKNKLAGIQDNANNYVHPATHPATIITEDETHRFTTDTEKSDWNDANNKKHSHSNKSILDIITQVLIDNWNAAYNHISDTVKHITAAERNLWNTVSNKVDKVTGKDLSTNDFNNDYKSKLDGISTGANKTNSSTTNGNIQIDGKETIVYTHPGSGTNPHGTTKSDVELENVTNDAQVKRSEMGVTNGVATLDLNGVNAQAPKAHIHDDRYYTESECDNKYATKTEISNAGYGDMLKSIYDKDNNGKIDKSEYADSAGNSDTVDEKHAADFVPNVTDISNTDLNNLLTTGFYQGCTVTNAPSNGWYYFVVIKYQGTGWCIQYATGFGSGSTNNAPNNIYMRVMRGGSWDGWTKVLTNKTGTTWNDLKGV
ncbi:pyocin knob domain-containing protein [Clostridium autoethanogenum]|uniref:pyocin knob domain-containing protein n=1 Tax=Clostridium autoethanogenum TaxID=84023 RepID=UPI001FAA3BA4|nr:pyocin knob domain-containing protein [Clostridium autoethanogenum]